MKQTRPSAVFYIAVLPAYRQRCIDILLEHRPDVKLYCAPAHLDKSVRTGIRPEQYTAVRMTRILGRFFIQSRGTSAALMSDVLVVDLNPRSITAWALLTARRVLGRRTLVWGHLYPQAGEQARTRGMRRAMRRLADGTISYTYENAKSARSEMPDRPVWVAPNALYTREELSHPLQSDGSRDCILYVGRFEPAKKVSLLVNAFAISSARREGARLTLVGDGSMRAALESDVAKYDLSKSTTFRGWVQDLESLREEYSRAFLSTSPGFAGLGLTQSLGFGVPILVAKDEPHSPEIELESVGGLTWAESNDPRDWADAIDRAWQAPRRTLEHIRSRVAELYSADAMAEGLMAAIEGREKNEYGQ